jgi:hypothetical protein
VPSGDRDIYGNAKRQAKFENMKTQKKNPPAHSGISRIGDCTKTSSVMGKYFIFAK